MKKIIILLLILLLSVGAGWFVANYITSEKTLIQNKLEYIGVVDEELAFKSNPKFKYQHEFTTWFNSVDEDLKIPLQNISGSDKQLMLTVEPWPELGKTGEQMYQQVISGEYNQKINQLCKTVSDKFSQPIIRWAHEVDLAGQSRYPWAIKNTELFKEAFQDFSRTCKSAGPNVRVMFSPAGIKGSGDYYPGNDFVDLIGLSIFGYPDYEQKNYKKSFTLDDVLSDRYRNVASFGKPIVIAELGVSGDLEYQKTWMNQAMKQFKSPIAYPLLKGFMYFDVVKVDAWEADIPAPRFAIDNDYLSSIID
jgi:endoglucanase